MLKKLLSIFLKPQEKKSQVRKQVGKKTPSKRKVEATRIGELGEYKINIQLDQLPKNYKHLSDLMISNPKSRTGYSQVDHVVISPYGLFVIETKNYTGEIKGTKEDKYWRVSNRYNLYNPLKQNYGHIKALQEKLQGLSNLTFFSMVSFTMRCRFSIDPELRKIESDQLVIYDTELSEFIQRKINRIRATSNIPLLSNDQIQSIYDTLDQENITDPGIREQHISRIQNRKKEG